MYWRLVIIVFWLALGLALFGVHWLYPEVFQGQWQPGARTLAWLAILYAAYHSVRLGIDYSLKQHRRKPEAALFRRRLPPASPSEPDPNFNFTDPEPTEKDTRT
jgi:hypothetical protein